MRRSVLWILALVAASPTDPQAHDWERRSVVVRLYATGDVPAASPQALSAAATILEDAGGRRIVAQSASGPLR